MRIWASSVMLLDSHFLNREGDGWLNNRGFEVFISFLRNFLFGRVTYHTLGGFHV